MDKPQAHPPKGSVALRRMRSAYPAYGPRGCRAGLVLVVGWISRRRIHRKVSKRMAWGHCARCADAYPPAAYSIAVACGAVLVGEVAQRLFFWREWRIAVNCRTG